MDKIEVIMPCYIVNDKLIELTKSAIESLGKVFLIIVDNCSPLGGGYLRSKADLYIKGTENKGYAWAVNQGLKLAEGPIIAIANNDVRVSSNWQEAALEVFKKPKTYSCHFRMTDYDIPFSYGDKIYYTGKERWCTSSFFVINNKKPFLYDPKFLNSYCDWDYWERVRSWGYFTAYTNKACYQHLHSTTINLLPQHTLNNENNKEYFKQKHGEYAEVLFEQKFPDQMEVPYWEGFNL